MLTIAEAAARLGLSRGRVWQLVRAGRLPARRIGPLWAIREADLRRFAALERPAHRPAARGGHDEGQE